MFVIPAEAGIQFLLFAPVTKNWIPDCRCAASGMTGQFGIDGQGLAKQAPAT